MPDNRPERHHFIPAFAQQPFTGGDGLVCEMRLVRDRIVHKRVHPNATGYQRNLYRTDGVPLELSQHLETDFFAPLDTKANTALQRMLAMDPSPWPADLLGAWTTYLLSMMFRNPETVSDLREHSEIMWREGLAVFEADYANRRRPDDPPDFTGYFAKIHPATPYISATNFLMQVISNERVGPDIAKMHWSIVRPQRATIPLLLSDRPLIRPFGLGDPHAFLMMPISPDGFFLASNDPNAVHLTTTMDHDWLVNEININVVGQAVEYVWGTDDSQLDFVRENFGTSPLPPPITVAQRERAVAAARGEIGR